MKKLSAKELEDLKGLRQEHYNTIYEIGEVNVQIDQFQKSIKKLEEEKTSLLASYAGILLKEQEMAHQLSSIYGEGEINIETGEIS